MTSSSGGKVQTNGAKWPGPVTFNDDDPRKGYSTIFLSVPGMTVNKSFLGLGKSVPRNAQVKPEFTSGCVNFTITTQVNNGENSVYEYKKPLPEDIDPDRCDYKVKKGLVVITLCKKSGESWTQHAKYLIKRDEE